MTFKFVILFCVSVILVLLMPEALDPLFVSGGCVHSFQIESRLLQKSTNNLVLVSSIGLWCPLLTLFTEYPVLRDVVLNAYNSNQAVETTNISEADVVYVGYGVDHRVYINDLVPTDKTVTIYVQCENFEVTDYSHQFIDSVDVSLGSSSDISAPNYQHTPCWLAPALSRDADYPLQFSPDLFDLIEPEVWRARSRFAVQISNHGPFPRQLLVDLLRRIGLVEQFGKWQKTNTDWPSHLLPRYPSNRYFFRHFRYAICPESQLSPSGGYITEKLVMAHLSGAVPVFWGDKPTFQVFNPGRILTLNVNGPNDPVLPHAIEELLQTVQQLETNATFRKEWFGRPILMASAPLWVESWISNVTDLIKRARALQHKN